LHLRRRENDKKKKKSSQRNGFNVLMLYVQLAKWQRTAELKGNERKNGGIALCHGLMDLGLATVEVGT
jgi:hypothetical protein